MDELKYAGQKWLRISSKEDRGIMTIRPHQKDTNQHESETGLFTLKTRQFYSVSHEQVGIRKEHTDVHAVPLK